MILIDTNILLYAVNSDAPQHKPAKSYLERLLSHNEPWSLCWANIYEFLRAVTHPRCPRPLSPQQAWTFIEQILKHPRLHLLLETNFHSEALKAVLKEAGAVRGNLYHDCHIAALMKEHGVAMIATADTEFRKFRFLKITNPV